jgi:hypothetical protein
MSTVKPTTFMCQTAGSTFITPAGKTLRFMGNPGGVGHYSTTDAGEIEELMKLHKNPQAQIELVLEADDSVQIAGLSKAPDPALDAAAQDTLAAAARASDPKIEAAAALLAKAQAANAAKGQG